MTVLLPPEVIVPLDPRHRQVPYVLRVTAALEELQTKLSVRRGNMRRVVLLYVQIADHIPLPILPRATCLCDPGYLLWRLDLLYVAASLSGSGSS